MLKVEGDTATIRFPGNASSGPDVKRINLGMVTLEQVDPAPATPYAFTFPRVIRTGLNYQGKLTPTDHQRVDVPDARKVIGWYFRQMYDGVAYERFVHSEANRSSPNTLTRENFEYTRKVTGIGWSYVDVEGLIGRTFEELEQIPVDADIFETTALDTPAVRLLTHLHDDWKGIAVANATKLLYQKRPRLIPILDDFARRAMGVHWTSDTPSAFALGFSRVREVAAFGWNPQSLDRLLVWLADNPDATAGLALSRLRVVDVLAWCVIWQFEHPTPGTGVPVF